MSVLWVALGGAAGAAARYSLDRSITAWSGATFPYGTLLINVTGSFAIGILVTLLTGPDVDPRWRPLLIAGFLGGYTTFSGFSIETLNLLERGHPLRAALYVISANALALTACYLGLRIARSFTQH